MNTFEGKIVANYPIGDMFLPWIPAILSVDNKNNYIIYLEWSAL